MPHVKRTMDKTHKVKNSSRQVSFTRVTCLTKLSVEMTLQWCSVAPFLIVEIFILLILCLTFISAIRWQSIFQMNIWNRMAKFWNKFFLTMIVLFLDAVQEFMKYSSAEYGKEAKLHPNMFDHLHMKLFRAQRDLYISGFSLILWLVIWRVITLINQLAVLQKQADNSNQAAKKYMEDNNELHKQVLSVMADQAALLHQHYQTLTGKVGEVTVENMDLLRVVEKMETLKLRIFSLTFDQP